MQVIRSDRRVIVDVTDEGETARLAEAMARVIARGTVIGLNGPLGAGKTRLVRSLAESLGADPRSISSPTFVLIHEYDARMPIYHFDAYRLSSADAFEALGVAEYWDSGGLCLVEWADRVAECLPADRWTVTIEPKGPRERCFTIEAPGERAEALVAELARGE